MEDHDPENRGARQKHTEAQQNEGEFVPLQISGSGFPPDFSFLSATTDTNIATTDVKEETSAPVIMSTNNNSNAIDSAFADLAALAPTPPTIQDNSNTTTPVTSQLDNNNTSTTTNSNLSSTTLNENDVKGDTNESMLKKEGNLIFIISI